MNYNAERKISQKKTPPKIRENSNPLYFTFEGNFAMKIKI